VVDKTKLSLEEDKLQRELFWYREELFKCVHGHWREASGSRSGELSFRQQRMTLPMLETLRTEAVRIHLQLFRRCGEAGEEHVPILRKGGTYYPASYEFVYLRMRIANLSLQPLILTADTVIDPADHAIQEGAPSGTPVGRLESGAERELETPICFVACGQFHVHVVAWAISAAAREVEVGSATLKAVVRKDNPP